MSNARSVPLSGTLYVVTNHFSYLGEVGSTGGLEWVPTVTWAKLFKNHRDAEIAASDWWKNDKAYNLFVAEIQLSITGSTQLSPYANDPEYLEYLRLKERFGK